LTRHAAPNAPALGEPQSGVRFAIDALIQASLVDLCSAYGVALAPLPRHTPAPSAVPEVTAAVAFRGWGNTAGSLTLSLPSSLLNHMKNRESTSVRLDWARELTNQLIGRIKNRLLLFGVRLEIGAVTLVDPNAPRRPLHEGSTSRTYAGRTLRGLVLVTVQGLPKDLALTYVGGAAAVEGSVLWL
jgi:hypothetical protein